MIEKRNIPIDGAELKDQMEKYYICPITVGKHFGLCDNYVRRGCTIGNMREDVYKFILKLIEERKEKPLPIVGTAEADIIYSIHICFDERGKPVITVLPGGGGE